MALGLNDDTQFLNDEFRNERIIRNKYIKSEFNNCRRTGHDADCQRWIKDANLICLFGLSLGDTDKRWWIHIGTQLRRGDFKLLIFWHIKDWNISLLDAAEIFEEEEKVRDMFLDQTSMTQTEKKACRNNIYVTINSKMFNFEPTL